MDNNRNDISLMRDGNGNYSVPSSDDKVLAMLIFLLSFVTAIIGPLIIWLLKRNESAYIDYYGKEYFNMFISYFIYGLIAGLLMLILIGYLLAFVLSVMFVIFTIIAAIKAFNGEYYRIPFLIRFIK